MRLLVSVANAVEAAAAHAGGADVIDAKDPTSGALGAVSLSTFEQIASTIDGARPVTAALGDARDETAVERAAYDYAARGATLVKIGFEEDAHTTRVATLLTAAVRGAQAGGHGTAGVVAVAYADSDRSWTAMIDIAAQAGAVGVLLDTARKDGPGLCTLVTPAALATWVAAAHEAGLLVALAGRLTIDDLACVRDAGADIAGVRGAACDHGRAGRVAIEKVRQLQEVVSSLSTRTCA